MPPGFTDDFLHRNITRIWLDIDSDQTQKSLDQLTVSLYLFPTAVPSFFSYL